MPTGATTASTNVNKYGVDRSTFGGYGKKWRTASLFVETTTQDDARLPAPYTLNDDVPGKVSLRQIYMECSDPTEYKFAIEAFGSWQLWEAIQECAWFKPYLNSWRAELAAKIRSDAIDRYALLAKAKDPNAVKWFADKGWEKNSATEKKDKRGKGRPSNEDVKGALKNIAQEAYDEKEALRRMGLLDEGT